MWRDKTCDRARWILSTNDAIANYPYRDLGKQKITKCIPTCAATEHGGLSTKYDRKMKSLYLTEEVASVGQTEYFWGALLETYTQPGFEFGSSYFVVKVKGPNETCHSFFAALRLPINSPKRTRISSNLQGPNGQCLQRSLIHQFWISKQNSPLSYNTVSRLTSNTTPSLFVSAHVSFFHCTLISPCLPLYPSHCSLHSHSLSIAPLEVTTQPPETMTRQ